MAQVASPIPERSHLLDYVRVLLKRLWLIVGFFVVVVGLVGFATWRATPIYRATAVLDIRPPSSVMKGVDFFGAYNFSNQQRSTQLELLKQRSTVVRVVQDHQLESFPEYQEMSEGEIVSSILGSITVTPKKGTTLVFLSVEGSQRTLVHKVANAIAETFEEMQAEEARGEFEKSLNALESEWAMNRNRAQLQSNLIGKLMEANETDRETFQQDFEFQLGRLQGLMTKLDGIDDQLGQKRSLYDLIRKARESGNGGAFETLFDHPSVTELPRIREYEKNLLLLQRRVVALGMENEGPASDLVKNVRASIENERALMENDKKSALNGFFEEYRALEQERAHTEERLKRAQERFRKQSQIKRRFDELMESVEGYRKEADRFYASWEKGQSRQTEDMRPVRIREPARPPFTPVSPDKQLNMILAIVFGLLGGIGLAFFLEYMDDTIKTKEELQRLTQIPLFGVIPNIAARKRELNRKDLYAYEQPKSTISEAFRGIRTALSYSSQKQENRLYLVTSGGPKEGKTTIAVNLATVMAYSGTRTLLVDCDLRKPRMHRSFSLENSVGLSNAIMGEESVMGMVQKTHVENLDLLTSGPIPPNPSELLLRDKMLELLEELRLHYDRILLDTPPIGAVTDAAVLGRIVDSVILVIHAGKTRRKLIERGLEQLSQIDVDVSGIILNNLKIGRKRYYPGYYHYYYYYSSYYGSDEKVKRGKKAKK